MAVAAPLPDPGVGRGSRSKAASTTSAPHCTRSRSWSSTSRRRAARPRRARDHRGRGGEVPGRRVPRRVAHAREPGRGGAAAHHGADRDHRGDGAARPSDRRGAPGAARVPRAERHDGDRRPQRALRRVVPRRHAHHPGLRGSRTVGSTPRRWPGGWCAAQRGPEPAPGDAGPPPAGPHRAGAPGAPRRGGPPWEVLHALLERAGRLGVLGLDDLLELPPPGGPTRRPGSWPSPPGCPAGPASTSSRTGPAGSSTSGRRRTCGPGCAATSRVTRAARSPSCSERPRRSSIGCASTPSRPRSRELRLIQELEPRVQPAGQGAALLRLPAPHAAGAVPAPVGGAGGPGRRRPPRRPAPVGRRGPGAARRGRDRGAAAAMPTPGRAPRRARRAAVPRRAAPRRGLPLLGVDLRTRVRGDRGDRRRGR